MMRRLLTFALLMFSIGLSAQETLIQWTGSIRDELLKPIPFVHIIENKDFRGTISDPQGRFSIIAYPNDTLYISCVGFKPKIVPVPALTPEEGKHYLHDIILEEDTIMLGEVYIFPWKTYKEFKDAFMELNLPEDDLQRAYKNISSMQVSLHNAVFDRPTSPTMSFRDMTAQYQNKMMHYGQMYPTYSITNPLAWARFFQAIKNGDFKRKYNESSSKKPTIVDELRQAAEASNE